MSYFTDKKVIDIIHEESVSSTPCWISIEFFPPKSEEAVENLMNELEILKSYNPKFVDFTWGAGGSTSDLTFDLCLRSKAKGVIPNMHLTCTNMEQKTLDNALQKCKDNGICNLIALRGDPPVGQDRWVAGELGLECAFDLISYIKKQHDDFFCIGVSGYPEGHPNSMSLVEADDYEKLSVTEKNRCSIIEKEDKTKSYMVCRDENFEKELDYLKQKIDNGGHYIITQMFFDVELYKSFVSACRRKNIDVPILPGIMSISNYGGFHRMTKFCKSRVPQEIYDAMEVIKDDIESIREYGVTLGIQMCSALLAAGAPGLHFYTLNSSYTTSRILEGLGFQKSSSILSENSVEASLRN